MPRDIVMVLDGGRPGNDTNVSVCLSKPSDGNPIVKQKAAFHIMYDEESYQARRKKQTGVVNNLETILVYGKDALSIPRRKRLHFSGSTYSSVLGPVKVPSYTSEAQASAIIRK